MGEARRAGAWPPNATEREEATAWLAHPVFICGHHRSGTTLLSNLFDDHPQLVVLPNEGTYLTSCHYVAHPNPGPQDVDRFLGEWIRRFINPNYEPHFSLGQASETGNPSVLFARRLLGWHPVLLDVWPERAAFALLLALVAAFHDTSARTRRPELWVEKTPLNESNVKRLATAFSNARFIHMVRDPRATLASLLESYRSRGQGAIDAVGAARRIGRSLRLAHTNLRRYPTRYFVVRYEDLVENVATEMERVRRFLGITPDRSLRIPTVVGRPVSANSSFQPGEVGVIHQPRTRPILSATEAMAVDAFSASPGLRWGYDAAPRSSLEGGLFWVREEMRHVSRPLRARLKRKTIVDPPVGGQA